MIARLGVLQNGVIAPKSVTAGNYRYTRRLNAVGAIEADIIRLPHEWIDQGAYAEVMCDGRIDAVYRLMDYERGRSGVYRVYGEDMMHLLARYVRYAYAGTSGAQWSGDAGAGIVAVAQGVAQHWTTLPAYSGAGMMCPQYVEPTVTVTVKYAWATALEAMQEIAEAASEKGYPLWFGVGGARCVPDVSWGLVLHGRWRPANRIAYRATAERYRTSSEGNVVFALGRGQEEARENLIVTNPVSLTHRLSWWERRTDARVSGDVSAEGRRALLRWRRRSEYADPLIPTSAYWRELDLGDEVYVQGRRGANARVVTGVTVSATQAGRAVEFDMQDAK